MLAPLSWLREYVSITASPKDLGERLTEIGLGTEKISKDGPDTIFEFEITPNRPDLLSILGIAREIAAVEKKQVKFPKINLDPKAALKKLPLTIKTDEKINPRFTAIIIDGITVKDSPEWLVERLAKMGQRSINNVVDITNYVMLELGNPIHAFDYDKIEGHLMKVDLAKDGEIFKSVDGIAYHLPKGTVVIRDEKKIIDLCGIKGGENSGTYKDSKRIVLRAPVEIPVLIRKASQFLGLRSDASSIFERGVNTGGTVDALRRSADLILELAGGEIASDLFDIKKDDFAPWDVAVNFEKLHSLLGITISEKEIFQILTSLSLSPKTLGKSQLKVTVPTYRNDLKLPEDIIEEVARLYGYNKFPKTTPSGQIPTEKIPYAKDYRIDEKVKRFMVGCNFHEVYTYSLISEKELEAYGIDSEKVLRVDNPVSREFEYLRPTLKPNLVKAYQQNKSYFNEINLFEIGKVYLGHNLDAIEEAYVLSGISNNLGYFEIKGILERLFADYGIDQDVTKYIQILDETIYFELPYGLIVKNAHTRRAFVPLPRHPSIIEDMAFVLKEGTSTGKIMETIQQQSSLITEVTILDTFEDTTTFRIQYQHREKNLSKEDVEPIRKKIVEALKNKHKASLKE